jgi:hypothetical protein
MSLALFTFLEASSLWFFLSHTGPVLRSDDLMCSENVAPGGA